MTRRRLAPPLLLLAFGIALLSAWHAGAQTVVMYEPGWNLIAGPSGSHLSGAVDPIYTFQPGDEDYETFPAGSALVSGQGYWAYFPSGGSIDFAPGTSSYSVRPVSHQFVMAGNPSATSEATVAGADAVYLYAPSTGYTLASTIPAGRGAWAEGFSTITLTAAPPPSPSPSPSASPSPSPSPTPLPRCSTTGVTFSVPGQDCRITGENTPSAICVDGFIDYTRSYPVCSGHGGVLKYSPGLPGEGLPGADAVATVVTAMPSPTPSAPPASLACSAVDANKALNVFSPLISQLSDQSRLIDVTPRLSLPGLVSQLQTTKRQLEQANVPSCAGQAKTLLARAADAYVNLILAFIDNQPSANLDALRAQAVAAFDAATRELSALSDRAEAG